ncbi:hypothetical protein [Streptomyces silvensis]|uniref:Uncharacterized protein n=1 Tax=Streptomyces silvensis TaxID=1765722 RepID=A0A0W7X6P6_9ACTN|nr:hypothetical protein [Streptomyces silvensis]KUF18411.1 hypothetical protein AT728_18860 [Streptomyces silvensis]
MPESLPSAMCLATSVYAALSVPVLLVPDDPQWPSVRELIETRAGDRLLVEAARARDTARDVWARAAQAAVLLLRLSARKGAAR